MRFGDLTLFNALDEGVVAVDPELRIAFFNPAAERMFGYTAAEALGRSLDLLIPDAVRGAHRRHVAGFRGSTTASRMMAEGSGVRGRRKDGSIFDAESSITRSSVGDTEVYIAVLRDVTARKAAEARLLASEHKHRAILDTCTDAILLADAETGLIVEANEPAAEMFGCSVEDLLGLHQSELHPPADRERLRQAFREHIECGRILVPDATIQRRDGTVVPVEIAARPTSIDGRPTVVGFFRDITHRRQREAELIEAREAATQASQSKTTFLANVSHELRTPLNAVIALSEMIATQLFGPVGHPKYLEYARDIHDSGHHLLEIIEDILDLSRVELGKLVLQEAEIDVAEVIDRCRRTVGQMLVESGLADDVRIEPGAGCLHADPRAVRQMLLNLLSNAIRHTPRGGRIEVAAEAAADGGIVLSVADTGVGIAPERLPEITTPFNSGNLRGVNLRGGTGLGLAITRGLVERHGGRIEVSSRLGAGTTVRLHFPAGRVRPARDGGG